MTVIPHCAPPVWPGDISSGRFASTIRRDTPQGCRIGLIGLADDLGVRLNNGRPGAKEGPRAFRAALARYGVADPPGWDWPAVFDAGDIVPAPGSDESALRETHGRVTEAVAALLDLGLFPIGIGGGHDLTFPFVRAAAKRLGIAAGVYFDAHFDVRETAGSGMAFRRLVEDCGIRTLHVHGLSPLVNSREHWNWFKAHGGRMDQSVDESADLDQPFPTDPSFVSLDLDVVDASEAPGVSAPNPAGWSAGMLEVSLETCGAVPGVKCFDIMELNPSFDQDGRTARVAAHALLWFLRGFARRKA